jgi:hypothetical protein
MNFVEVNDEVILIIARTFIILYYIQVEDFKHTLNFDKNIVKVLTSNDGMSILAQDENLNVYVFNKKGEQQDLITELSLWEVKMMSNTMDNDVIIVSGEDESIKYNWVKHEVVERWEKVEGMKTVHMLKNGRTIVTTKSHKIIDSGCEGVDPLEIVLKEEIVPTFDNINQIDQLMDPDYKTEL